MGRSPYKNLGGPQTKAMVDFVYPGWLLQGIRRLYNTYFLEGPITSGSTAQICVRYFRSVFVAQ